MDLPFGSDLHAPKSQDRNFHQGGRSFYFFDFDDNVIHLPTESYIFNKVTGEEKILTTAEFTIVQPQLGRSGPWLNFEIRNCDQTGTFRRFREKKFLFWRYPRQPLLEDMERIFARPFEEWKGPSWNFFWYACHNQRPMSIITARGHHPKTLKKAIKMLKDKGFITHEPNYLSIYPVSHKPTRKKLGDVNLTQHPSALKQEAIRRSVKKAFRVYGHNPGHRFGMSDDDPTNLRLIIDVMRELKRGHGENSFFVIDTHGGRLIKQEIFFY
jgi:hypothetical protein